MEVAICTTASSLTKLVSQLGGMSMMRLLKPGGRLGALGACPVGG
jgi:hypothetical protein